MSNDNTGALERAACLMMTEARQQRDLVRLNAGLPGWSDERLRIYEDRARRCEWDAQILLKLLVESDP